MNSKSKTIVGIVIFAAFLGLAYFAYSSLAAKYLPKDSGIQAKDDTEQESQKIPAPDFTVFDAEGKKVKLSDFAGKPVVLNFWASWCPPCKSEMPHFNEVYKQVKDDVVFMMVDLVDGQRETQAKGRKYIEEQGFIFPVYYDNEQEAAYTYGITSIPTTLFIDSEGNIITGYQGAIKKETLLAGIDKIMK